jgi:hypothetical protein
LTASRVRPASPHLHGGQDHSPFAIEAAERHLLDIPKAISNFTLHLDNNNG